MKIQIKNSPDAVRRLIKDCVPISVVEKIIGRQFDVPQSGEAFSIPFDFDGVKTQWSISPECVEIVNN